MWSSDIQEPTVYPRWRLLLLLVFRSPLEQPGTIIDTSLIRSTSLLHYAVTIWRPVTEGPSDIRVLVCIAGIVNHIFRADIQPGKAFEAVRLVGGSVPAMMRSRLWEDLKAYLNPNRQNRLEISI